MDRFIYRPKESGQGKCNFVREQVRGSLMVVSAVSSGSALAPCLNWRAAKELNGPRVLDLLDVSHVTTAIATFDVDGLQNWCGR